ncbi:aminotransferase class I/II-fold pyridoxal phosphate-dependent enzyme [Paenibacillus sp. HB172176]|uniref:aminotransferase class I/II-fold pyridoxal phosphate-dependent enzyme n=1 Tax=Paenibacillus sp. HB172176 TaxID=2493690 RepID=UPI00143A5232|nr:aminotransferase class I/II-fold pyridoxal phosphate-dependent enzyme [Paenibacillus sp. HB172176]
MKKLYAPLFEALKQHIAGRPSSFHVPGHHYGQAISKESLEDPSFEAIREHFQSIMKIDVTELSATDDLHHPEASILEAQRLAAESFGSDETFFLVGGSTSGNLALLLALCEPNDIVIVQRNVHKSIINGLKLSHASPVFLSPELDPAAKTGTVPSLAALQQALERYPEAKAVCLTNPNYYGIGVQLAPYVELAHRYDIPLIVDEAHGAHYGRHPGLPESALQAGADAVVQSTHKTLQALTMGAMLHIQGERVNRARIRDSLQMIQSSSPSFPILASLDISRAIMDMEGPRLIERSLAEVDMFNRWICEESEYIKMIAPELCKAEAARNEEYDIPWQYDPLRVLLYDNSERMSGFELQQRLEQHGCWIEMADLKMAVLVMGLHSSEKEMGKLKLAILSINQQLSTKSDERIPTGERPSPDIQLVYERGCGRVAEEPVSFNRIGHANRNIVRIAIEEAAGEQSAEMLVPYPPGIPIVYQNEYISTEIILSIKQLAAAGAKFQGAQDQSMRTIAIYSK